MTSTIARFCVVLLVLASSCAKAPPARCPEEAASTNATSQQVNSDEHVRVTTTTLPADPTAAGALKGDARVGARAMRGVVLLDYSGSMYGGYDRPVTTSCPNLCKAQGTRRNGQPYYYSDPSFQRFLAALVDNATPAGTQIDLRALLFNKQVWTFDDGKVKPAPTALTFPWSSTMSSSSLAAALATIPSDPFAATGKNADETHIQPALARAVDAVLQGGDEGIVWLVTDNIADQSGGGVSADDARRNLAFYEYLKREPRLQLVYAYPVHDAEQCTWLCGSSLFVYALQVSSRVRADVSEVDRLSGGHLGDGKPTTDGVLWNAALQSLTAGHAGSSPAHLAGVPLRLKPMDLNAVSVSFAKTPEGKTQPLRCKRTAEFGDVVPCVATLVVKNNLRHERIDSARLAIEGATLLPRTRESPQRLSWAGAVCAGGIKAVGATAGVDDTGQFVLGPILPGAEQTLQVRLLIPAVTVAPTSPSEIIDVATTDALLLQGPLTARIRDVRASLVVSAADRRRVYGAEALPQIFTDRSEAEVVARFPVIAVVNNDGKLQALLLVGGLLALLIVVGLLVFVLQPAWCTVLVDGVEADRLRMRRFSSRPIDLRGVRYGQVKRGVGVPAFVPARGAQARRSGSAWLVAPPSGSESRIELRQGWRSKKAAAASTGF
jgi:hypothetical protein